MNSLSWLAAHMNDSVTLHSYFTPTYCFRFTDFSLNTTSLVIKQSQGKRFLLQIPFKDKTSPWHAGGPPGGQIWKASDNLSFLSLYLSLSVCVCALQRNVCPGVKSSRKDISWTLIWDYSPKLQRDERGITVASCHFCLAGNALWSHLGYYRHSRPLYRISACGADVL